MLAHEKCSSSQPPTIGPSAIATPAVAPHRPIARARSVRSVKTLEISDSVVGNTIAAPRPMKHRAAISSSGLAARPPAALDSAEHAAGRRAASPLRPTRSQRLPAASSERREHEVVARRRSIAAGCSCACSSRTSVGSATLTIVVSRLIANAASSRDDEDQRSVVHATNYIKLQQEKIKSNRQFRQPDDYNGGMRAYGQYCAVAKALDLIGDRWTLLVVRELLAQGPVPLHRPAQRPAGDRHQPPLRSPARSRGRGHRRAAKRRPRRSRPPLFKLTPRGEELAPVLRELLRWGMPLMQEGPAAGDAFRGPWMTWPAEMSLLDREPGCRARHDPGPGGR